MQCKGAGLNHTKRKKRTKNRQVVIKELQQCESNNNNIERASERNDVPGV